MNLAQPRDAPRSNASGSHNSSTFLRCARYLGTIPLPVADPNGGEDPSQKANGNGQKWELGGQLQFLQKRISEQPESQSVSSVVVPWEEQIRERCDVTALTIRFPAKKVKIRRSGIE